MEASAHRIPEAVVNWSVVALPTDVPFWEQARGGGPVTAWRESQKRLEEQAQERQLLRDNPQKHMDERAAMEYEARRKRRHRRLCISCPKVTASGVRCARCQKANRDRVRALYEARRDANLCVQCGKGPADGARCSGCKQRYNTRQSRIDRLKPE